MLEKRNPVLNFNHLRGDIYGGLTAAVVALPLALAFGMASGAGPAAGLYGAILVGFFAAFFGGTPTQVSGPTGPMTVVMTAIIMQYSNQPTLAFAVVFMGGAIQILFGIIGWGRYVAQIPFPVVSGFMSGIGCIIIIIQLSTFLGHPQVHEGIITTLKELPFAISSPDKNALFLGLIALITMWVIPKKIQSIAPPPLVALIVGTIIGVYFLTDAPRIGEIPNGIPMFNIPEITISQLPHLIGSALVLATLGTIDSLLTSLVADNLTRTQHQSNKELVGQGIGNMVSGLFGGLPGAGATMRTVVNIKAGGKTKLSGMLHAIVLAAMLLGIAPVAENIPLAVLAGILIKVGWDIIDWNYLKRLSRNDLEGTSVMFSVLVVTVTVDLITAVAFGLIIQFLLSSKRQGDFELSRTKTYLPGKHIDEFLSREELKVIRGTNQLIGIIEFNGSYSFSSAKKLSKIFASLSTYEVQILHFKDSYYLDTTIAMEIETLFKFAGVNRNDIIIAGLPVKTREFLDNLDIFKNQNPIQKSSLLEAIIEGSKIFTEKERSGKGENKQTS